MEALGLVRPAGAPVAWRRPPAKPENFIARNKIQVRDSSRKQKLAKTTASSVPHQRKPSRTAAAHQRKPKEASPPREAEGSVLVSKQYLEELLRFKVHNSVALSTTPDPPPLTVVPSSSSRVGWPREEAQAEGDHRSKAHPSSAVVECDRTDIPGLGRHEGGHSSLTLSQVEGGEGPWQSTPCKSQESGSHFSGRGLPCEEPEGEEYFPWGRPGGGAPLLRSLGRRCAAHVADSGRAQGLQSVKGTATSHDMSHDRSHDMCKSNAIPPRPVPAAMRCSISITGVGDDQSEKEKKQTEQRRWLQDLQDQIQAKKTSRSLAVPPAGDVDNVGSLRSSGSPGEVGVSPVSPREEHFGRGGGPHVDQFALREKEDRRRRELENREHLKAQVEEKRRQKEEERRRREEEARLEDERVAVEQARLQAEYQREQEKAVQKEKEALCRHALLQERLSEAQQAAAEAKQKRMHHGSPQQWEGAGGRVHGPTGGRETGTINIVIGEEQTPPTKATRVSPFPTSVDHTDGADRLSHSTLRSPSLLMFDPALIHEAPPPTKKHIKDVVVDLGMKEEGGRVSKATGEGGHVSKATGGGHVSKATGGGHVSKATGGGHVSKATGGGHVSKATGGGHVSKATGGGHVSKATGGGHVSKATGGGHVSKATGGGHVSRTTGGGGGVSQSTGSKQSAKTAEVVSGPQQSACRPVGPTTGATSKSTAVQQPGGHKRSERRVRAIPQQPGGQKFSKAQGRCVGEVLSSKNTLEGPKCLSVSSTTSPVHGAQASEPAHAVGGGLPLDHLAIRSQAVSPPVPALRKKLGALPQAPPPNTPPLLEAHTEHQPVGLDEERGGVQVKLPGLARHKCVLTSGVEGGQGQMGVVLSTLANLKQTLLSAEQKVQLHFLLN